MKKILWCLTFILAFSAKTFAADYYLVGVDAFKKGCYDQALPNLEHAVRINPKNVNARYYLAQIYLLQNRVQDASDQYNRIILIAPSSDAAILSQRGISLIYKSYIGENGLASADDLARYKDNYLDYVLTGSGDINKWAAFPVSVYIEPKKQKDDAKKAFDQWQDKTSKLVSFTYVDSPEKAGITVSFVDKMENSSTKKSYEAGDSKPYYQGNKIIKSEIRILTKDPETGEALEDNYIMATALHEMGHSLGFVGHSPKAEDVMSARSDSPKTVLTVRDINTMCLFYKIDKKTLMARNSGQTDLKLQQALDYVKNSPEKAVGWANLGDIYRNKKMYKESIGYYQKALSIEPDSANMYAILGSVYLDSGDKQNAFVNMQKSCDLEPSNRYYLAQFVKLCKLMGKDSVAKSYADAYQKANPKDAEQLMNGH